MATQNENVVALLRLRGERGVTPLEALNSIGTLRLAARINDIRDPRRRLISPDEEIVTENASLDGKTFARYVLRKRVASGVVQTDLGW